jgi:hypothetical protein
MSSPYIEAAIKSLLANTSESHSPADVLRKIMHVSTAM